MCPDQEEISVLNLKATSYSSCLKEKKNLMSLLLKTIFNQISCATGRRNSLQMLLSHSIISGKTISGKNLPKNARKKPNTPKRSVNLLCRLTGSKKNLKKLSDLTTRVNLVRNLSTTKELSVSTSSKLLGINRTSVYYEGLPVSQEELECKSIIDHLHTDNPTWGARQMSAQLKLRGYHVGRRKASRYMREMDITPIYPKMNLSKRVKQAKVCPYLLRNAVIDCPNQAWSIDITYISMKHGFLYLTAIINWYSHCIVGWDIDDTLDTTMVINACKKAFKVAKPLIINSDQGSQFTSDKYIDFIRNNGIRQSMDGKSRWADNIMIERWFRSFKYEEAYLTEYANLKEAREAIGRYIYTYNFERSHQSIENKRPAEVYYPVMLLDAARAAA